MVTEASLKQREVKMPEKKAPPCSGGAFKPSAKEA